MLLLAIASPPAKKRAEELGINIFAVTNTEPEGRVTTGDVQTGRESCHSRETGLGPGGRGDRHYSHGISRHKEGEDRSGDDRRNGRNQEGYSGRRQDRHGLEET